MPSPVLQAQRQSEFLRKYLNAHAEILLGKILGFHQASFRNMPLDILVAISDSGIINRPKKVLLEEVCKADQVTERIRAKFEKSRKANSLFNLDIKESGGTRLLRMSCPKLLSFWLSIINPPSSKSLSKKHCQSR
jgi:hypothetical protein